MLNKVDVTIPVLWDKKTTKLETGLSDFTISQFLKSGKVKYIRLGRGERGKILINAESLCNYLSGGVE